MSQDINKKKALEAAIAHIEKQFGSGSVMTLGKHSAEQEISVIKTGSIALDKALGIGGIPRGRIIEIYGPESSGKSTLATHIVSNAQKTGGIAAYIDAEHAFDPGYAAKIGVNLDELIISQPDSGEEALNIAETLARSNAIDVIIIDSVAALVPKSELEGEIGDSSIGLQARLMSQALRKLTSVLANSKTSGVFLNQIREKIGVMFGNPETTSGGRALKFYSSVRIDIRKVSSIKNDAIEVGIRSKAKVVKNKMAPPFQTAEFDIIFGEGISTIGSILDLGIELGVIKKSGSWLSFNGNRLGQGRESVREDLKKNSALTEELEKAVLEKVNDKNPQPKEILSEELVET